MGRGFRPPGPVEKGRMARIVVISGAEKGREYELRPSQVIGRLKSNEIPIADTRMSRENTRIFRQGRSWVLQDLDSKNGTFLNGSKIEAQTLSDNDEIRVGETWFSFLADEDAVEQLSSSSIRPPSLGDIEVATTSGKRQSSSGKVSDKHLSYSKYSGLERTNTSFFSLRQDISQRSGSFRILVFIGVGLIAIGLFWLIQMLVGQ